MEIIRDRKSRLKNPKKIKKVASEYTIPLAPI
jgi:hypothetical protein